MGGRQGRPKGLTTEERFWEKVDRSGDCWEWQGGRVGDGIRPVTRYGRFALTTTRGTVQLVLPHRYSWVLHFGPVPEGMEVCHACDKPRVREAHASVGRYARCQHADDPSPDPALCVTL